MYTATPKSPLRIWRKVLTNIWKIGTVNSTKLLFYGVVHISDNSVNIVLFNSPQPSRNCLQYDHCLWFWPFQLCATPLLEDIPHNLKKWLVFGWIYTIGDDGPQNTKWGMRSAQIVTEFLVCSSRFCCWQVITAILTRNQRISLFKITPSFKRWVFSDPVSLTCFHVPKLADEISTTKNTEYIVIRMFIISFSLKSES